MNNWASTSKVFSNDSIKTKDVHKDFYYRHVQGSDTYTAGLWMSLVVIG